MFLHTPATESMEIVTVSPRFQVVIPERVRKERGIHAGDRIAVVVKHGVIQLIPVRAFSDSGGMLRGMEVDSGDPRDHSDRD